MRALPLSDINFNQGGKEMSVIIFIFLFFISQLNAAEVDNFSKIEEIIVKSTRSKSNIYQLGSSVDIITSEQIKKNRFNFVSESLQVVPGLYISQNGALGGTATARIRGAASGQTLVLIDGISVSDPSTPGGEYDFSSLLSSNIERIEILKGSQSTIWGSDAIGGVINIITGNEKIGPSIMLNTEIGSFDTQKIGANLMFSDAAHNLFLSFNQLKSDGISKADKSDGNSEKDGIGSKSYLVKTGHKISGFEISTNLNYRESDIDYDSFGFATGVTDGDENTKGRQINWQLEAKKSFFDNRFENTFSYAESETDRKYYTNGIENFSAKGKRSFLRYIGNYSLNQNNFFTFGAEAEDSSTFDNNFETKSLFFLYEVMLHEDLGLSFGLREDKRDNFPSEETPKVTAYFNINDNLRLSANWGEGFKLPTIFQSTFFCCGADRSNNDLLPETSEGYEVGLAYESNEAYNIFKFIYFDQEIRNMIDFSFSLGAYENLKLVNSQGFEINFASSITDNITLSGSYSKTDSTNDLGIRLIRLPEEKANLNFDFSFGVKNKIFVSFFYNGDETDPRGNVESWFRSDINISRKVNDSLKIYFKIKNIFDENYQDIYGYGTEGRSFNLGLSFDIN